MRWERAGSGSRMKVVLNTWLASLAEGIAETAVLAQSLDVSLSDVSTCLASTALDAPWALTKLERIERNAFDPDFSLALASKGSSSCARRLVPCAPAVTDGAIDCDTIGGALQAGLGNRDVIGAYRALAADRPSSPRVESRTR